MPRSTTPGLPAIGGPPKRWPTAAGPQPRASARLPGAALSALVAALLSAGCSSLAPEATLGPLQQRLSASDAPGGRAQLQRDAASRAAAAQALDALLAGPLDADGAVRAALLASPALQALLAEGWAADLDQQIAARPPLLRLGWERLAGSASPELTRSIGLSLTDLVLWPARQRAAELGQASNRLQLAQQVLTQAQRVRQRWVLAVADRERLGHQQRLRDAADAGAELAQRMLAAGHFSRLQRDRETLLQADAAAQQARAEQAATASREALVRAIGLSPAQALRLRLPEHLAELPAALPAALRDQAQTASLLAQRLDVAVAAAALAQQLGAPALAASAGVDLDAELLRKQLGDERSRGLALGLAVPLGATASAQRQALDARSLAAAQRLAALQSEADSQLRERLAGWRSAHALALHAQQELLPLRQRMLDDTLLRANGMLASVFELLGEARGQLGAVISATEARRDFWLADAALQAAIDGVGVDAPPAASATTPAGAEPAGP